MLKKLFSKKTDGGAGGTGFTLVELLVVMAIIAVLVTLIIIAIQSARRAQRDTQRRSNMNSIKTGLEAYYAGSATKNYPAGPYANLPAIQTGLGNYLSGTLSDPSGAVGNNRYCYARNGAGYRLRMRPEGAGGGTPSCTGALVAGDESFDMNP